MKNTLDEYYMHITGPKNSKVDEGKDWWSWHTDFVLSADEQYVLKARLEGYTFDDMVKFLKENGSPLVTTKDVKDAYKSLWDKLHLKHIGIGDYSDNSIDSTTEYNPDNWEDEEE